MPESPVAYCVCAKCECTRKHISTRCLAPDKHPSACRGFLFQISLSNASRCRALQWQLTSGSWGTGGIAPKLIARIKEGGVQSAFLNHRSRFSPVLQQFPLYVILNDSCGLKGTIEYALSLAKDAHKVA